MKKIILLIAFIFSLSGYGQAEFEKIQITENTVSISAPFVNVQESNGVLNKINKTDLQDAFYFATASALPVTGITDKLYITRDDNKLYRFNGTIYVPLNAGLSGSGTANFIPKFTDSGTVGNSSVQEVNSSLRLLTGANSPDISYGIGKEFSGGNATFFGWRYNGGTPYGFIETFGSAAPFSIQSGTGRVMIGSVVDDGANTLQIDGNATAFDAVSNNQLTTLGQVNTALALKANLASPTFTGTPTAPTATAGTNTTQIATTAFVLANAQSIPQLESNATDLTVWNNGKGNVSTNTSFGDLALRLNTSGGNNTAIGRDALSTNTTQSNNTAVGVGAGSFAANGTTSANTSNSVYIGGNSKAGIGGGFDNEIVIGANTTGLGSNTAIIGNASTAFTRLNGNVQIANILTKIGSPANNVFLTGGSDVPKTSFTNYTNQTITANKTVTIAEFVNNNELILSVNATSGNITITLPTFTALQGYKVTVKKMDSSANSVLIQGVGGINIDGQPTLTVSGQYSSSTVGANLSQYIIL